MVANVNLSPECIERLIKVGATCRELYFRFLSQYLEFGEIPCQVVMYDSILYVTPNEIYSEDLMKLYDAELLTFPLTDIGGRVEFIFDDLLKIEEV